MYNDKNPSTSTDSPTKSLNSKQEDSPTTSVSDIEDEIESQERTEALQIKTSKSIDDWANFSFSSLKSIFSPSGNKYEAPKVKEELHENDNKIPIPPTPTKTPPALRAPELSNIFSQDPFLYDRYQEEETKEIEETTPFLFHPQEEIPESTPSWSSYFASFISKMSIIDVAWLIFASLASIPSALNTGVGICGESPETFNYKELPLLFKFLVFPLFFGCSFHVNTDQANYFTRETLENLFKNFSHDQVISTILGFLAAGAQVVVSFEATKTLFGFYPSIGFVLLNTLTFTSSREKGIRGMCEKIKNLYNEKIKKNESFIKTLTLKQDIAKILKQLDQDQQNMFLRELKEVRALPSTTKALNKLSEEKIEQLLEEIYSIFDKHQNDWQLHQIENTCLKKTGSQIFNVNSAAFISIASFIVFFQKSLDAASAIFGGGTIAHSGLFLQCLIGLIGAISVPLYIDSVLQFIEKTIENLKENFRVTSGYLLENAVACFSMKPVAEGVLNNPNNIFNLKQGEFYNYPLIFFLMAGGFMINVGSSLIKFNNAQPPTKSSIAKWVEQKEFTEPQFIHLKKTHSLLFNKSNVRSEEAAPLRQARKLSPVFA